MKKILIHYNTLVDFRIAAVDAVCPEAIPELLKTYDERLADNFEYPNCPQEEVDKLLANPQPLLERAQETPITTLVRSLISRTVSDAPHLKYRIVINMHPISMSPEDKRTLKAIMEDVFDICDRVDIVSMPYHLYRGYLKDFELMVCYNLDWTAELGESLREEPLPGLTVYAARVIKAGTEPAFKKFAYDAFSQLEIAYFPVFALNYLPVKMFNVLTEDKMVEIINYTVDNAKTFGSSSDGQ